MVYYSSSEDESRFQQVSLDDNVKIENVTLEDFGEPLPSARKLLRCSSSSSSSDDEETTPELEKPKISSQKKTQLATIVENSDSETEVKDALGFFVENSFRSAEAQCPV